MKYIPPFEMIIKSVDVSTSEGELMATAPYEELIIMIKRLLCSVEVNEGWYLSQYPDVANALKVGDIKSAKQHYIDHGYFENRMPFPITVDEDWYVREYPDVASSIRDGVDTAQDHFVRQGYREGRMPSGS